MSSQAPNVGILEFELPHTQSSIEGSTRRMALPASAAIRPYSSAVFWPICQGPSISLPRHHSFTPYGSDRPFSARQSALRLPAGELQYSTRLRAASTPRVPRLTASIGSVPALRRPGDELVGADLVGLDRAPGEVEPRRPLLARADAVLPVVGGHEVAARVAHDGDAELARQLEHVAAEAVLVGGRVARLVDAAVDGAPHVLDERAEQPLVHLGHGEGRVEHDACAALSHDRSVAWARDSSPSQTSV